MDLFKKLKRVSDDFVTDLVMESLYLKRSKTKEKKIINDRLSQNRNPIPSDFALSQKNTKSSSIYEARRIPTNSSNTQNNRFYRVNDLSLRLLKTE